ncbi:MAG: terminase [Saprospirales bacterium TMED214]|nr:MAG: terminase [Saprospirales bacterium TMED214]
MKDNKFDKLNDTFNLAGDMVSPAENEVEKAKPKSSSTDDIKKDYEYTRGNLYSIIEKGQEALNGALEMAQENGTPREYEVVGQLVKSVSDATDKLLELQKKVKDVDEDKVKGPTNVTNALFVGSTAELQKLIKNQNNNSLNS